MWVHRARGLVNPFTIRLLIGIAIGLLFVVAFMLFSHPATPV